MYEIDFNDLALKSLFIFYDFELVNLILNIIPIFYRV